MGPTSRDDLPQKEQEVMRRPRNPPPPDPPPGVFAPPALLPAGGCAAPPPLPEPVPPLPVRLLLAMLGRLAFRCGTPRASRTDTHTTLPGGADKHCPANITGR